MGTGDVASETDIPWKGDPVVGEAVNSFAENSAGGEGSAGASKKTRKKAAKRRQKPCRTGSHLKLGETRTNGGNGGPELKAEPDLKRSTPNSEQPTTENNFDDLPDM